MAYDTKQPHGAWREQEGGELTGDGIQQRSASGAWENGAWSEGDDLQGFIALHGALIRGRRAGCNAGVCVRT